MTKEVLQIVVDAVFARLIAVEGNHTLFLKITAYLRTAVDANLDQILADVQQQLGGK